MCSPSLSSAAILFNLTSVASPVERQTLPVPVAASSQFKAASQFNFDGGSVGAEVDGRATELFSEQSHFPPAVLLTHQHAYALAVSGQLHNRSTGVRFENAADHTTFNSLTAPTTVNIDNPQGLLQPDSFYPQDSVGVAPFYAAPASVALCHPVVYSGVDAGEVAIRGESNNCGPLISSTSQLLLNELDHPASLQLQPPQLNNHLLGGLPEASVALGASFLIRSQQTAVFGETHSAPLALAYPLSNGRSGEEIGIGDRQESVQALSSSIGGLLQNGGGTTAAAKLDGGEVDTAPRKWRKRKNAGTDGRTKDKKTARRDTAAGGVAGGAEATDEFMGGSVRPNTAAEVPVRRSSTNSSSSASAQQQQQRQRRAELDAVAMERRRQQLLLSREPSVCTGCAQLIRDSTLLIVVGNDDDCYHDACLKCSACERTLADFPTCYVKEGAVYCRSCYSSKFHPTKCTACERQIQPTDWVRRARDFLYHLACFACQHCKRQLSTGEEFSLQENQLLCRQHYLELVQGEDCGSKQKMKRVRTTFADEQIGVLQAHFQIDSNPDGADLERIANLTGLSKRVTQVWFQNNRARQKKYQGAAGSSTVRGRSRSQPNNSSTNQLAESTEAITAGRNNSADGGETGELPLAPPSLSPDASSNEARRISDLSSSTLSN